VSRRVQQASWIVVPVGFFGMACLLLWAGIGVVVRCDRVPAGTDGAPPTAPAARRDRVDVAVDYRVLGLLTVRRVGLVDVERADWSEGGSRGARASSLILRPRDGQTWSSPSVRYVIGTPPREAAARINAFIVGPAIPSLGLWWASWLPNALAIPLLLVVLLFLIAAVRWLLGLPGTGRAPGP
jgi:hypothetical protein